MSSLDAFTQVNYLPDVCQYSTFGYGSVGLSVAGTFTGNITAEGSDDGSTWQQVPIAKGNTQLANDQIITEGSYVINAVNYALIRLVPNTFTGTPRVTATVSPIAPPPFMLPVI
jgi:hypothetical protein